MMQDYQNIYVCVRKATGFSQERWAEKIGVSTESVQAYEQDRRIPPNAVVVRMADVGNAPYLPYQHMRHANEWAQSHLPDINTTEDIRSLVVRLEKEMNDFLKRRDDLVDIVYDGVITPDERPVLDSIIKELEDIAAVFFAMQYRAQE